MGNQVVIRLVVRRQGGLVVLHAIIGQRAKALARPVNADDAFQRIVGAAGGGQQGIAGAQQAKQGHGEGVGAAQKMAAAEGILGAHQVGKHPVQLFAARVVVSIAGAAHQLGGAHLIVGKGAQHPPLVFIADRLHLGKLRRTQFQCFFIQLQHLGLQVKILFNSTHTVSNSLLSV